MSIFLTQIESTDEMSKQEHQAVVEGVDASVLHSFAPSNPDLLVHAGTQFASTQEKSDVQSTSTEAQQKDIFEVCICLSSFSYEYFCIKTVWYLFSNLFSRR